MEKLIYLLYNADSQPVEEFGVRLRGSISEQLLAQTGVRKLRMCVADASVEQARPLRIQSSPILPDAVASIWMDTCVVREPIEAILATATSHRHGYLVTESAPLVNDRHPADHGERVYGMCQIAIFQKPSRLSYEDWLSIWQGSHTRVAIDNQSTFGYRQNVIVRALTYAAPVYHAIVEENFPPEAMTSSHVFYAADGDDERLKAHTDAMMESCARFIDFDRIDAIPMSEYVMRG